MLSGRSRIAASAPTIPGTGVAAMSARTRATSPSGAPGASILGNMASAIAPAPLSRACAAAASRARCPSAVSGSGPGGDQNQPGHALRQRRRNSNAT